MEVISCGKCGAVGVRIYRAYGMFYRPKTNRCNDCVPEDFMSRGWYVPCVPDSDGTIWGYTSAPISAVRQFDALPEKNPSKPKWVTEKGQWSDQL